MKALQKGDYVKGLNGSQFKELVAIEGNDVLTYKVSCHAGGAIFISKSLTYSGYALNHTEKSYAINKLTFEEFKERAINTFTK